MLTCSGEARADVCLPQTDLQWLPQETVLLRSQGTSELWPHESPGERATYRSVGGLHAAISLAKFHPGMDAQLHSNINGAPSSVGLWSSVEYNASWEHEVTHSWGRTVSSCERDPDRTGTGLSVGLMALPELTCSFSEGGSTGLALWRGPVGHHSCSGWDGSGC